MRELTRRETELVARELQSRGLDGESVETVADDDGWLTTVRLNTTDGRALVVLIVRDSVVYADVLDR